MGDSLNLQNFIYSHCSHIYMYYLIVITSHGKSLLLQTAGGVVVVVVVVVVVLDADCCSRIRSTLKANRPSFPEPMFVSESMLTISGVREPGSRICFVPLPKSKPACRSII